MATANYNEVTHSNVSGDINSLDPMFHWDTRFPERLSKLHLNSEYEPPVARRARRSRTRNAARYKTQPITFDEIKEVDEEPTSEDTDKAGLKNQFAAFSRSMDGLLPGYPGAPGGKQKATSPPTSTADATETSTGIASDTAVGTEHANSSATSMYNESFRRRRKKRQQRSIEEVPETDKTDEATPTVG
ncbi:hypothetical protein LSAT2_007752 [Lamellibrachia satsuma]|nr:hypothetical protein LSAT2_007752 [Lamellibrachia satsuma]